MYYYHVVYIFAGGQGTVGVEWPGDPETPEDVLERTRILGERLGIVGLSLVNWIRLGPVK